MAKFIPNNTGKVVLPIVGGLAAAAITYYLGKKLIAKVKDAQAEKEAENIDVNNPRVKLATQLASRANVAMEGGYDGTDSDELNRIAVSIHQQGSGFFELVSNSFKKLTGGKNLLKTIQGESSPGEYARFLRCLNTGKFEADSWLDGITRTIQPANLPTSKPNLISMY